MAAMSASPKPVRFSVRSRSVRHLAELAQLRHLAQLDDVGELLQEPADRSSSARACVSTFQPRCSARNSAHIRRSVGTTSCLRSARLVLFLVAPFSGRRVGNSGPQLAELERTHRLEERLLERAADRHRLAHRLHLRRQRAIGLRELLEVPARELDDDVVDGRLERRRRQAGDVVRESRRGDSRARASRRSSRSESRSPSTPAPTSATRAGSSRWRRCGHRAG